MREVTVARQEYKNNGMESAPEMDMPAEKIYEQSVLKQKQRDQCYWMTVTASIKEHTHRYFGVTFPKAHSWGPALAAHPLQHALKPTEVLVTHQFCRGGLRELPGYFKKCWVKSHSSLSTDRRLWGWQQHSASWGSRVPSRVQASQTLRSSSWVMHRQKAWDIMLWVHNSQNV